MILIIKKERANYSYCSNCPGVFRVFFFLMYRRCVDDEIMMIMMIVMMMIMMMTTTPYVGRVLWLAFIPAAMAVFSGSSVYLPPQK